MNADDIQNAHGGGAYTDPGVAGAVMLLVRDLDGDGAFTGAGEVLATPTTDADRDYAFKGLASGLDHEVEFFAPPDSTPRVRAIRAAATRSTATPVSTLSPSASPSKSSPTASMRPPTDSILLTGATANTKPTGITPDPTGQSKSLWIVDETSDTATSMGARAV